LRFLYREHQTRKNKKAGISTDRFQYIITAGYIVEPCLGIIDIAPVAQGVVGAQGAGHGTADGKGLAPGVVGVGDHSRSGGVQDGGDIALEVGGIIVGGAVVGDGHGCTAGIVGKIQRIPIHRHLAQLAAVVDIAVGIAVTIVFGIRYCGLSQGPVLRFRLFLLPPSGLSRHIASPLILSQQDGSVPTHRTVPCAKCTKSPVLHAPWVVWAIFYAPTSLS